jgi:hypothetical protein
MASQSRYITHTQFVLIGGILLVVEDLDGYSFKRPGVSRVLWGLGASSLILALAVPFWTTFDWLHDLRLADGRLKAALALSEIASVRPELQALAPSITPDQVISLTEAMETEGLLRSRRLNVASVPRAIIAEGPDALRMGGNVDSEDESGGRSVMTGWAAFPAAGRVPDAVVAGKFTVDGHFQILAVSDPSRIQRRDVKKVLKFRDASFSGWRLVVPESHSTAGLRVLGFDALANRLYFLR